MMQFILNIIYNIYIYGSVQVNASFLSEKHVMDPYKLILCVKLCLECMVIEKFVKNYPQNTPFLAVFVAKQILAHFIYGDIM